MMTLRDNELTQNTVTAKNNRLIELLEGQWRTKNLTEIGFKLEGDDNKGRWTAKLG